MRNVLTRCTILALIIGPSIFPLAAVAQATASIVPIRSATLTNKVALEVPVTATCGPLGDPFGGPAARAFVNVTVTQAAGHALAQAGGTGQVLCDGAAHAVTVTMTAANVPFHSGQNAVVSATLDGCGLEPGTGTFTCVSASTSGPIQLRNSN